MADAVARREWWKIALFTVQPGACRVGRRLALSGSGYGNPWFDVLVKPPFVPPGWCSARLDDAYTLRHRWR
jgi:hypothetical protein